jgi:hypothetical protein
MLAERPKASASDSRTSVVGPAGTDLGSASTGSYGTASTGSHATADTGSYATQSARSPLGTRSARKKRGLFRRTGILLPAAGLALLLVVVVWGAAKVMIPKGTGASSLFQSIDSLGNSGSVALLEQERQTLIEMTAAAKTLTVASRPATSDPEEILQAQDATTTASSSQTTGGIGITTTPPPADPTAAEATGQAMLASFGFDTETQWPCLYDLWQRESGWNVYAENGASGAYGIPQSLPGDKMASAGADWQTDAATQIRWGLGYIKSVYGTPCAAWQNELNVGSY